MTDAAPDNTNDPRVSSWVLSANAPDADFPPQNLPFAVFRTKGSTESFRGGVAIGDQIIDLGAVAAAGLLRDAAAISAAAASQPTLNALMQLGEPHWAALRGGLFDALRTESASRARMAECLRPQCEAEYAVPAQIGDYTDFYSSIHHATSVGRLFRPDNPLLPNYRWMPIGYHGRSSSIGISGQNFPRPIGQQSIPGASQPVVGPSRRLDYELELGIFIGSGNDAGRPIGLADAESHVFGLCLLNDWSARDIQAWEYQPLGPFLAKNFATTISPWVVSLQALAPFRVPLMRDADAPPTLPYLDAKFNRTAGGFDIHLEAWLETNAMRARGAGARRLSASSFRHSYWTIAQLIAHHTMNGCNLRPGDLLGTGTQSGPGPDEAGSLLELSAGGKRPIDVGAGEQRTFLEDGDCVVFKACCEAPGLRRIGFGEVRGTVQPPVRSTMGPEAPN